jgi:hypothetical protein
MDQRFPWKDEVKSEEFSFLCVGTGFYFVDSSRQPIINCPVRKMVKNDSAKWTVLICFEHYFGFQSLPV